MIPRFNQILLLFPVFACAHAFAGSFDDVTEEWCLDAETKEIYTVRPDGARELLVVNESVVVEGEAIDDGDMERMFGEGLVEAVDGADALSTSFVADAWETVIETFYGHDAFGQRVEIVGEQINDSGHRCRLLKAPGFTTMFRAFRES